MKTQRMSASNEGRRRGATGSVVDLSLRGIAYFRCGGIECFMMRRAG